MNMINKTLSIFNSFYQRLQFTIEIGDTPLNFLDVKISNNINFLEFDGFHKPIFWENILTFYLVSQKRKVIIGLIELFFCRIRNFIVRILILSIETLLNNDPLYF